MTFKLPIFLLEKFELLKIEQREEKTKEFLSSEVQNAKDVSNYIFDTNFKNLDWTWELNIDEQYFYGCGTNTFYKIDILNSKLNLNDKIIRYLSIKVKDFCDTPTMMVKSKD